MPAHPFHLFERFGVELEYMIVDAATLDVRPISDQLMHAVGSARKNEVRHGALRWSNELVLHVIELKTDGPQPHARWAGTLFQEEVRFLERHARQAGLPAAADGDASVDGSAPRRPGSGRTATRRSTRPSTASSTAAGTAGPTCNPPI